MSHMAFSKKVRKNTYDVTVLIENLSKPLHNIFDKQLLFCRIRENILQQLLQEPE